MHVPMTTAPWTQDSSGSVVQQSSLLRVLSFCLSQITYASRFNHVPHGSLHTCSASLVSSIMVCSGLSTHKVLPPDVLVLVLNRRPSFAPLPCPSCPSKANILVPHGLVADHGRTLPRQAFTYVYRRLISTRLWIYWKVILHCLPLVAVTALPKPRPCVAAA